MDQEQAENLTGEAAPERPRRWTRRAVLKYGLAGAAGIGGAGAMASFLLRSGEPAAEIFKGDAPSGETWQLWLKRGWAREASHYTTLGRNVHCRNCPNECLLEPEDRGCCRNRVNKDGKLYTMVYGNPCSFHIDPIEKKPLFHFIPGTGVFSIATSGCGFRCLNCQNWDISQRKPEETKDPAGPDVLGTPQLLQQGITRGDARRMTMVPKDVVAVAEAFRCPSIAYTYSEPTMYYEYMYDTARLARQRGVKNVWVTCGYINRKPLEQLCDVLDAANVDLKSFSDATYRKLNSGRLQPILDTLVTLKQRGVWFEVTNLVVPTWTDDLDMIRRMCDWMVNTLGPDYPLHFSRFFPRHKLTHLPSTPSEVLVSARDIARKAGLHYVYIGNLLGVEGGETTYCPKCGKVVIERYGYSLRQVNLRDGRCGSCQTPIAGVWPAAQTPPTIQPPVPEGGPGHPR